MCIPELAAITFWVMTSLTINTGCPKKQGQALLYPNSYSVSPRSSTRLLRNASLPFSSYIHAIRSMVVDEHDSIFTSMTLPDISSKSHIIRLVGTYDDEDLASPQQDGWFLSDFYLNKCLSDGLCQTQAWFTCLDPTYLIWLTSTPNTPMVILIKNDALFLTSFNWKGVDDDST